MRACDTSPKGQRWRERALLASDLRPFVPLWTGGSPTPRRPQGWNCLHECLAPYYSRARVKRDGDDVQCRNAYLLAKHLLHDALVASPWYTSRGCRVKPAGDSPSRPGRLAGRRVRLSKMHRDGCCWEAFASSLIAGGTVFSPGCWRDDGYDCQGSLPRSNRDPSAPLPVDGLTMRQSPPLPSPWCSARKRSNKQPADDEWYTTANGVTTFVGAGEPDAQPRAE